MSRASKFFVGILLATVCGLALVAPARAIDVIIFEELKEGAVEYGKISQRFVTCKMDPPYSVRTAFLKYAQHQGVSQQHLEILSKIFDDGSARVRNLRSGFSEEECKAKIGSPQGQKLLEDIRQWGGK